MPDEKNIRLAKAASEFNVAISHIVDLLKTIGIEIEAKPTSKISPDIYNFLSQQFYKHKELKTKASKINIVYGFPAGMELDLHVTSKAPPGLIYFDLPNKIQGILHISDLNWNFGLCQIDYLNIKIGSELKVRVIESRNGVVYFDRKNIITVRKPSELKEWRDVKLGIETTATIFEEYLNKVLVRLNSGLFATIPILENKKHEPGTIIHVIPIRKLESQNLIECSLKEIVGSEEEQSAKVLIHFKQTVSENNFHTSEICLSSIKHISDSIYWNYFEDKEREKIKTLFESTQNLFSKVEKGEEPIYFEFDFNNRAYNDFITNIAPALFTDVNQTEKDFLIELSKQSFWYTQYFQKREIEGTDQKLTEKFFSLYNEALTLWGKIEEGVLKILTIKAKVRTDSLKEKQQALKRHYNFLLSRPTIFYYKLQTIPSFEFNLTFIQTIDNKLDAFKLFEQAKEKSLDVLQRHGKDFKIFSNYLESQIDYETKATNDTEIELTECYLNTSAIQNEETNFYGKLIADTTIQKDEQVVISLREVTNVKKEKEGNLKPIKLERGRVISIRNRIINISCPAIDLEQIKGGCYIKKVVSTKQYKVQLDVLGKFFINKLPLENFYKIFHDREGIHPPEKIVVKFKDQKLSNESNPQSEAVKKAVGNKNILLVQGPPGTGKTTVITEIVKQLIDRGEKILVSSPTHIAVDNVLKGIKEDSRINIARIGHHEMVSDFAVEHLIEEARKKFAEKIQKIVEVKIDLINQHINRKDISQHSRSSFQLPYTFDWENIEDFIKLIQSVNEKESKLYIDSLEKWKEVIAKSPIILTDIFLRNLDVVFGTCIGIATNKLFAESEIEFDTVILDEAGKANISETLTAVSKAKKIILVGDHKQLPPYLDKERVEYFKSVSKDYEEKPKDPEIKQALGASFFEYLQQEGMLPDENKVLLAVQHRMHPDIGNFVSQSFYDSELKNGEKTIENVIHLPPPFDKQIVFIDTSSDKASMETYKDGSYFNQVEAEFIVGNIIPELLINNINPKDFAIVSPYSKQCEKITELLSSINAPLLDSLEIATLDSFQGRELDTIIFTFTRSSIDKTVGFLDDARRLNVAFSRAKKKLILIGNVDTLTNSRSHYDTYYKDLFWKLFKYSRKYGSVFKIKELDFRRLQDNIREGQIVEGTVKAFMSYGVFVNLGTIDGLIPMHEISWSFVSNPATIFEIKQQIKVKVLRIDNTGKISLSHKQTIPEPTRFSNANRNHQAKPKRENKIEIFEKEFQVSDIVEATIIQIAVDNPTSLKVVVELKYGVKGVFFTSPHNHRLKTGNKVKVIINRIQADRQIVRCKLKI